MEQINKTESQAFYQTVLFTDIKGSTAFFETFGDEAGLKMIEAHNQLLFPIIKKYKGSIIKTIGDAILAVFDEHISAVRSAIEMQVALRDNPVSQKSDHHLTVRMGLNAGIVHHRDNDIFGDAVNIASRMESLADGMQIIISQSVYESIRNTPGFVIKIQGDVSVKGHRDAIPVYRVLWDPIREYVDVPPSIPDVTINIIQDENSRKVHIYTRDRLVFGRQRARPGMPGADVVVRVEPDEEQTLRISRQHLLISSADGGYTVTDISTRGTELAGMRLPPRRAVELPPIGKISLGRAAEILFEQLMESSIPMGRKPILRMLLPNSTTVVIAENQFTLGTGRVAVRLSQDKSNTLLGKIIRENPKSSWLLNLMGNIEAWTEEGEPLPPQTSLELFDGSKWKMKVGNEVVTLEFIYPPR